MEITLNGIGVSPGIAIGPVLTFGVQTLDIPKYEVTDAAEEIGRFEAAIESVGNDLRRLQEQTAEQIGEKHANIFQAHLMILDDVTLREEIDRRVREEGTNAEYLVDDFIARHTRVLESVDDPRFRERIQDLVDVGTRILGKLMNTEMESLAHLDRPSVIVAHDLSPSDTASLDMQNTLGISTDLSGPTSHTAILARALEIPAVVGLKYVGQHTRSGDMMIVDGTRGRVVIQPSEDTLTRYRQDQAQERREREALLRADGAGKCITLDGYEIPVLANIELPIEVTHGLRNNTDGVGLYRTEYLYLNRQTLPTEEEQYEAYRMAAEALDPRPVILRTLDLGGDKFASHLHLADEINPQLGWRAIRFCLERPDIFKAQLRAMYRASVHGNIQIMFPLISGLDELRRVKQVVWEVCQDLERRGVPFRSDVPVGSMIEVPSAVVMADLLAVECDFFSIGTNDLIQYSLAVDRGNEKIAYMYEPAHLAVIRMIDQTVRAARAAHIPCGICGEMAGDPMFTELLLGLGVSSLSMSSVAMPIIRAEISNLRLSSARRFARRVIKMKTSQEIKAFMQRRFDSRKDTRVYACPMHPDADDNPKL